MSAQSKHSWHPGADRGRSGSRGNSKSSGHAKKLFLVEDVVSQWLREMKLVRSFYVERIAEDAYIYRVRIKRSSDSAEVLLPDVGFGASQVLPVLVLLACVPKTSVVILEQPELHLHPAVQAAPADAILETARVGRAQVIVESHSEYLLSRLQRRVAEGTVSKEDTALYFCDHDDRRSSIERLDSTRLDSTDRKFVATTVWSGTEDTELVNAVDSDYSLHRSALREAGVSVSELCPCLIERTR